MLKTEYCNAKFVGLTTVLLNVYAFCVVSSCQTANSCRSFGEFTTTIFRIVNFWTL